MNYFQMPFWIYQIWILLSILVIFGIFFRFVGPLFAIINLIVFGYAHSFGYQTHSYLPLVLFAFPLGFSTASLNLSVDHFITRKYTRFKGFLFGSKHDAEELPKLNVLQWDCRECNMAIFNMRLIFCIVFFSAGISKLLNGGIQWINGESVSNYLIRADLLYSDINSVAAKLGINRLLSEYGFICKIGAGMVVGLELSSLLALFNKKWALFIVPLLAVMQICIYFTIFVNFETYLPIYFCWLGIFFSPRILKSISEFRFN